MSDAPVEHGDVRRRKARGVERIARGPGEIGDVQSGRRRGVSSTPRLVEEQEHGLRGVAVEGHMGDVSHVDGDAELLAELAHERVAWVLALLHLPTGELPETFEVRPRLALREEDAPVFDDDGGRDQRRHSRCTTTSS